MKQFERDLDSISNKTVVNEVIEELGFDYKYNYLNDNLNVSNVDIFNEFTKSTGSGKGFNHRIGALAEAIEHYILENETIDLEKINSKNLANNKDLINDGIFKSLLNFGLEDVSCIKFSNYFNSNDQLYIPENLFRINQENLNTSELFLSKYCTNSGVAFGTNKEEAILHGTMELIERHYLSILYETIIIGRSFSNVKFLRIGDSEKISMKIAYPISLQHRASEVIISSSFKGIFFAAAIEKPSQGQQRLSIIGSGCSVDPAYAIYRAISEFNQVSCLYDIDSAEDDNIISFLKSFKKLNRLIKIDTSIFPKTNVKINSINNNLSSKDIMNKLFSKLEDKKIYFREIKAFKNGCSVCSTYIPSLERFNLIRLGKEVVPQRILCT